MGIVNRPVYYIFWLIYNNIISRGETKTVEYTDNIIYGY